ncbi:(2Fe-2S)-binding protein [Motilibacter aurantiacus]|uniref:(2Fe-2S)-binding protein n=1 Tax=Motilibacter aurantiacus TaxID=2714955 RepID=UPI00140BDD14|nr:(2Fe-2S)-binding protein [Motilibacter aurantiacus]
MRPAEISVDGDPVELVPGQTLAAAMLATGRLALRRTRVGGRPRGLFCGIGACFDCLVVLNGRSGVRACVTEALPGDVVQTQDGVGAAPAAGAR